jgi:hypothetical protein
MLLQGFGGYTHGCASVPPRNSTAVRREESPISKHQPLQVPNGYHCRGSGATVGDNHKGPLITGETPLLKNNKTLTNKPSNYKTRSVWSRPKAEGPTAQEFSTAHLTVGRGTPLENLQLARGPTAAPQNLRLARGANTPSGEA